jgi:acyl-CoA thioester hydrolase
MPEPFVQEYRARWSDMDFNQHMRNSAFLGCSEETRMRFLDAHGWTMAEFMKRRLGPVVLEDRLVYKKELALLERFQVDLAISAITDDGRRMKVRNRFLRASDGALCAVVESVVLWLDLDARRPVAPPADLRALWLSLARTEDFAPFGG